MQLSVMSVLSSKNSIRLFKHDLPWLKLFWPLVMNYTRLVLAGVIFFVVISMWLCFWYVLKTVYVIQGCFNYCRAVETQSQGLFCFSHHPTSE